MNFRDKIPIFLMVFSISVLFSDIGMSRIRVGGSDPIRDRGWWAGTVEVANLSTRFGWWEGPPFGGGEYHFLYRCESTNQFNEALEKFAAVKAERLELVVHNGPMRSFAVEGQVHWTFLAWVPKNWDSLNKNSRNFYRSVDSDEKKPVPIAMKSVPAPRVDVYLSGENPIIWKDVKIPKNLVVIDQRPGSIDPQFAGKGLVSGKVFDLETKQPIARARVVLFERLGTTETGGDEWKKTKTATTNSEGFCQIGQIPLGRYEISVAADGYVPVKLQHYDNTRAEFYEFEAGLLRPFTIAGIVTDTQGNPLRDIGVWADDFVGPDGNKYQHQSDSPVLTDEQGRFGIPDLPKGFARFRCRAEGLHQADSIFEMYPIPSKEIKLNMSATGIIRGKVVDGTGKRPSGEIHMNIDPPGDRIGKWGYSGRLSEDGTFEISGIPPGEYIISTRPNPSRGDYKPNTKRITVEGGKTYELEIIHAEQKLRR